MHSVHDSHDVPVRGRMIVQDRLKPVTFSRKCFHRPVDKSKYRMKFLAATLAHKTSMAGRSVGMLLTRRDHTQWQQDAIAQPWCTHGVAERKCRDVLNFAWL